MPSRLAASVLLAALAFALAAPAHARDYASTALNVLPSGNYQTPGPGADRQARLYDALTPRFDRVTDADLPRFFKSAALEPTDVVSTETIPGRPGVTIRRDGNNVPHVYGQTNDDVIFGAGYVIARDQSLLIGQARYNGLVAAIDAPNISAIDLISRLYNFRPSAQTNRIVARQTQEIERLGERGRQLLRDIDTYLAGMNAYRAANSPNTPPFTRVDIYALNAVKGQFLGQGGGDEPDATQFLDGLQRRFGKKPGLRAWEDMRNRNDPETTETLTRPAPYDTATGSRKGVVTIRNGSFVPQGGLPPVEAPDGTSRAAPPADRPAPLTEEPAPSASAPGARDEASNILILNGRRSATGRPLFVGGPQIRYFFPGLVMEMGLHGPDVEVRGAISAPFPGYMLIGRGEDYAWTLTSAGGDIVDSYAETLCGGSTRRYLYRGRCRAMEEVDAGTIVVPGGREVRLRFLRTVHGTVTGYARTRDGRRVAISRKRSSYGRDTVDQLFFQQMTFGRVRSFGDFSRAAALTPQTFNAFYADHRDMGLFTTGDLPLRPRGADGSLVTDGRGAYEWRGYLPKARHPQQANPPTGHIINWNNRPAPGFVGGDDRFGSEGPVQRDDLLLAEVARRSRHTLGSVVAAMNAAATEDVRARIFWPTMRAVLRHGRAPNERSAQMVALLDRWHARRGSRVDSDLDGLLDDPGVPIMDAIWTGVANASLCGTLGTGLCRQLADTLHGRFDQPPGSNQYDGWYHYMDKDFRTLLGRRVRNPFSRRYCAPTAARCAAKLWRAIDAAGARLARRYGPQPSQWREATSANMIDFTPLSPGVSLQYTNRPSGIQQVMAFSGHR